MSSTTRCDCISFRRRHRARRQWTLSSVSSNNALSTATSYSCATIRIIETNLTDEYIANKIRKNEKTVSRRAMTSGMPIVENLRLFDVMPRLGSCPIVSGIRMWQWIDCVVSVHRESAYDAYTARQPRAYRYRAPADNGPTDARTERLTMITSRSRLQHSPIRARRGNSVNLQSGCVSRPNSFQQM